MLLWSDVQEDTDGELRYRLVKDDIVGTVNCSEPITMLFYY